jgi:hypothetical protein
VQYTTEEGAEGGSGGGIHSVPEGERMVRELQAGGMAVDLQLARQKMQVRVRA